MIGFAPCGACAEYVPADTGCGHWKPGQKAEAPRKSKNRSRDAQRARKSAYRARQKAKADEAGERGRQIARGEA